MGDFDYDEEYEAERSEEEIREIKNNADNQMREYYNQNPEAKSKVNKIVLIVLGLIAFMIFALVMWAPR